MSHRSFCMPQVRRLVCERDDLGELLVPHEHSTTVVDLLDKAGHPRAAGGRKNHHLVSHLKISLGRKRLGAEGHAIRLVIVIVHVVVSAHGGAHGPAHGRARPHGRHRCHSRHHTHGPGWRWWWWVVHGHPRHGRGLTVLDLAEGVVGSCDSIRDGWRWSSNIRGGRSLVPDGGGRHGGATVRDGRWCWRRDQRPRRRGR
mmetsp:Transcript_63923/g.169178  ORF Transcript_63923/g.169178 Transcript_63923/m.169178 type:complete len:200 (-) Transcript_63923:118-717(-)